MNRKLYKWDYYKKKIGLQIKLISKCQSMVHGTNEEGIQRQKRVTSCLGDQLEVKEKDKKK